MHLLNAEVVHCVVRARGGAFHLQWRPVISSVGTYQLMCRIQPASDTVWHYSISITQLTIVLRCSEQCSAAWSTYEFILTTLPAVENSLQ